MKKDLQNEVAETLKEVHEVLDMVTNGNFQKAFWLAKSIEANNSWAYAKIGNGEAILANTKYLKNIH